MFDSRSEMVAWLVYTAMFFLVVSAVIALMGESVFTVVAVVVLLAVGCWLYPKVAVRFAKK